MSPLRSWRHVRFPGTKNDRSPLQPTRARGEALSVDPHPPPPPPPPPPLRSTAEEPTHLARELESLLRNIPGSFTSTVIRIDSRPRSVVNGSVFFRRNARAPLEVSLDNCHFGFLARSYWFEANSTPRAGDDDPAPAKEPVRLSRFIDVDRRRARERGSTLIGAFVAMGAAVVMWKCCPRSFSGMTRRG